jgi:hypothetical protein
MGRKRMVSTYGHRKKTRKYRVLGLLNPGDGRKRIEKEDDLINHRMSWCVGSNSFLVAAYALTTRIYADYGTNVVVDKIMAFNDDNSMKQLSQLTDDIYKAIISLTRIREVIPYIGCILSVAYVVGVIAAWSAIWHWRKISNIDDEYVYSPKFIAFCGSLPSICVPCTLLSLWVLIIFFRGISVDDLISWISISAFLSLVIWSMIFFYIESRVERVVKEKKSKYWYCC